MLHNLGHFVTRGETLREFDAMLRPNAYREVNTTIHIFSAARPAVFAACGRSARPPVNPA
jgi:hypothetical protein